MTAQDKHMNCWFTNEKFIDFSFNHYFVQDTALGQAFFKTLVSQLFDEVRPERSDMMSMDGSNIIFYFAKMLIQKCS